GHVMRCLAVAELLKNQSKSIVFICRKSDADLIPYIQKQGYQVVALSALESKQNLSNVSVEELVLQTLKRYEPCICIVDHYEIDWRWESAIYPFCEQLCVIDDLANRKHCCDILLDSELGDKKAKYQKLLPSASKLLLGPSYALLRADFTKLTPFVQKKMDAFQSVKVILINMGAYDQKNIIPTIIQVILSLNLNIKIRIVISSKSPNIQEIRLLAKKHDDLITLRCDVKEMALEIIKSDLAIGSVGGSAYERAVLGVSGCVIPTAENQDNIAREFERLEIARLVVLNQYFVQNLTFALVTFIESPKLLKKMAINGVKKVDVYGADNFVSQLLEGY
ncbi:hypothetical protein MNBD_GAMMA04-22, partial [hydrothermal vent metagenome]